MSLSLEVAVFSGAYGLKAQALGAKRIEINAPGSYEAGGLTPPVSELTSIASQLEIPVRIMIRPRGPPQIVNGSDGGDSHRETQDFIYTKSEIKQMLYAIHDFKASNVMNPLRGDAFVFGILKRQDNPEALAKYPEERYIIDENCCKMLIDAARPFGCIFHRAFDPIAATDRWQDGLDALIRCGFEGVLTAGGVGNCSGNVKKLDQMCHRTIGKLQIIAGGGVRSHNVKDTVACLSTHGAKNVWMHTASLMARTNEDGHQREELDTDELLKILGTMSLTSPD
ncbi:PF03932 family protein CutC [Cladobotryum mycophilum]|uniref:Copper homeostasis protein cutC homolog n=1 Tax=Cladobotryum mycophilum TaxID=491253 RepID=A0ABR0SME4_9HYPO